MKRHNLKKYLIISFIIHLILLLWFLFQDFYQSHRFNTPLSQEQKTDTTSPEILVMLSPSTSPNGESDIPTQEKPENTASPYAHPEEKPMEKEETPVKKPQPPELDKALFQKEERQQEEHQQEEHPQELPFAEHATMMKPPLTEDKHHDHPTIVDTKPSQDNRPKVSTPAHQEPQPSVQHDQPRKSILAMTSQLLKASYTQQGNSLVERDGEDRMPSFKELKYLSYEQRINEMIMNSWRIVSRSFRSPHKSNSLERMASISFEINKNGTLAFVTLTSSSGNPRFDKAVVEAVKKAAPFPPIPEHLGLERFRPIGGTYHVRW